MKTTAKFIVARNTAMGWATEVELVPDYGNGRNKEWAEATPAGMIRMTIKNDVAAEEFLKGTPFTVTFEPEDEGRIWDGYQTTHTPEERAEIERKNAEYAAKQKQ